jgi:hypothetical protein
MMRTHSRYRAGRVIQHRANAKPSRRAKCVEALSGQAMNEVARFEMRTDPAIEAVILPEIQGAGTRSQTFRDELDQAIDDIRSQAVRAQRKTCGVRQLPCRIAGVINAEHIAFRQFHREWIDVAGVRGCEGNFHFSGLPNFASHSSSE